MPADLEKALICEQLNWQLMPWELDELDLAKVRLPLQLLYTYHLFKAYGKNIKNVSEGDIDYVSWVEKMRQKSKN
jgi:hypothetical protein